MTRVLLLCFLSLFGSIVVAAPAVGTGAAPVPMVADGAADARQDFAAGIMILLGGEGVEPGMLDLGNGLEVEIATDACALGPDPAGYIADYNREMKARVRAVYGIDVDDALLKAAP